MPALIDAILAGQAVSNHRPWPRAIVKEEIWRFVVGQIADGHWTLLGLWGDAEAVHLAALDEGRSEVGVVSLDCTGRLFPSVAERHPPAIRLERTICDLYGFEAEASPDTRPWLDHGHWGIRHPLGDQIDSTTPAPGYDFRSAEGEGLHQIAVGPVHAGIIEPGHFRFTANGEAVVRLEERLGYVHKGIEGLMIGADLARAAGLAGRTSGDSTVAYGLAFARAAEAALSIEAPPRAIWLRALMGEIERLANHFGDIGAICNDASFAMMHAQCGILRERMLRAADTCFGHRLMRDRIVPGGVNVDLSAGGTAVLRTLTGEARQRFAALVKLYDNTASLQDRTVGTGILQPVLARQFGCGGYVGRASGRAFDTRRTLPYPPYDKLRFDVPTLLEGDVNARIWIRIREVEQSLSLIDQILDHLPDGSLMTDIGVKTGEQVEGIAVVEGFRGDVFISLSLDREGKVARCHMRDPSWFQWPVLEAAIEGNIVADFPLCNKSFNCSYSGHDL